MARRDRIFISYRREDARADARSVYQRLVSRFGRSRIFMDVDSIDRGLDFRRVLDEQLRHTRVLVVLIGKDWLNATDRLGGRRLDDPADFVRMEVARALKEDIAVIPVLVDNAPMPEPHKLPEDLRDLVFRQAQPLRHESFASDMAMLEVTISRGDRRWFKMAPIAAAAALMGAAAYGVLELGPTPPPTHAKTSHSSVESTTIGDESHNGAGPIADDAVSLGLPSAPGARFRDCPDCPEMVVIGSGAFWMGSPDDEADRHDDEGPRHHVSVASFAFGRMEVTRGQFASFVQDTTYQAGAACVTNENGDWIERIGRSWKNPGYSQTDDHPVVCVSQEDAQAYVEWLAKKTGRPYRLPSEAEQEFALRAGSETSYFWGEDKSDACRWVNAADKAAAKAYGWNERFSCDDSYAQTAPVGSFPANSFGLHDIAGNVWEWTQDCWNASYERAPTDGSAWMRGDCSRSARRGGSWYHVANDLRSALRLRSLRSTRASDTGIRVALSLAP